MTQVPFYPNTDDDTHCFQACLRSVLKYFEPSQDFSWEHMDKITNKPEGMWTWPMAGLTWMSNRGYQVLDIEPFDYDRFITEGSKYMTELWGEEVVKEQIKNSNLQLAQHDAVEFIQKIAVKKVIPTISDIRDCLSNGYLVICNVNASVLNNEDGFVGHSILIIKEEDRGFIVHDPGLPPLENRFVSHELFEKAWANPNSSAKNLAAIKR